MASYSKFITNFTGSTPSIGTDLMSTLVTSGSLGYMYIGELLINFSIGAIADNTTVTFAKAFTTLYGVVCTDSNNTNSIAAISATNTDFFMKGKDGDNSYFFAWGK